MGTEWPGSSADAGRGGGVGRCAACPARDASDPVTGLADRRVFLERLTAALAAPPAAAAPAAGPAVLLIDLDRFKAVNDSLGHPAGDALLRSAGARLRSALRGADGCVAARLGGDEFAVLLPPGAAERPAVRALAERLVDLLSRPYIVGGRAATVGASVGAAVAPGDGNGADALLSRADLALYASKNGGRGRFSFFEPAMEARAEARRLLEHDLRAALPLGQLELHYQPQLDLARDRLTGFEALLRWRHPDRGLVPPDAFVPLAEEVGLISAIGEWVLRAACEEAARWPGNLRVAVNVAAPQFETGRLVGAVTGALAASGLPGGRLELELTESALLRHGDATLDQLRALKRLGVQVSLDDFGTGYSSLTQLRSFPFDRVKIDRSFADDAAVVRAVAALGASLGMRTTAEGVETPDQLRRLRQDGCTEAQGYLLGRPVPAAALRDVIERLGAGTAAPVDGGVA